MTATIDRQAATVTPIRQVTTISEGLERRVTAIVHLANEVADANDARCKTGLPIKLWPSDCNLISGLLSHTAPDGARGVLIEAADWIMRSRGADEFGRELADAILADTLAAGAA